MTGIDFGFAFICVHFVSMARRQIDKRETERKRKWKRERDRKDRKAESRRR